MVLCVDIHSKPDHWQNVFEDLWTNLLDQGDKVDTKDLNSTGADVKLCLSDGQITLHRSRLVKFTTLLDFANDKELRDYADPWGCLTLILPHFNIKAALALGRLMYCGDSGNVTSCVMQEVNSVIRPEFGGVSSVKPPQHSKVHDKESKKVPSENQKNETISSIPKAKEPEVQSPLNGQQEIIAEFRKILQTKASVAAGLPSSRKTLNNNDSKTSQQTAQDSKTFKEISYGLAAANDDFDAFVDIIGDVIVSSPENASKDEDCDIVMDEVESMTSDNITYDHHQNSTTNKTAGLATNSIFSLYYFAWMKNW